MSNKYSYFQGTEEPTPKKKKYKSDKAIVVQPRFEEPLYHNYDLYDVPGNDKKSKLGPGAGWHSMQNYKSIADFLKARREYMKDKYKAKDSYIEDTENNKKERISKMKIRAKLLYKIVKIAIDFPSDNLNSGSILGDSGTYSDSIPIGGLLDKYLPEPDLEGKSPDKLNFGRDYAEDNDIIEDSNKKSLNPKETPLYGLPDGIIPQEDLDSPSVEQPQYGITDSGNTTYEKLSF